jgi:VAD1 Analog of StAR-related lipid transfer domain
VVPKPRPSEEWTAVSQKTAYSNLIVKDHVLKCNLNKYFELFWANDAQYSVAKFLERRGDSNLRESTWKDAGMNKTRVVSYSHPVNAPLAPPMAGARKEQSFQRYGNYGLLIETRTFVDDVPLADCFFVADRIRVQPQGDDSVSVVMDFEITFVKSTMFKSIISRTTSSEFTNYLLDMANFMTQATSEKVEVQPSVQPEPVEIPTTPVLPLFSNLVVPLLLLVLTFQIWIIMDVRGIKQTIRLLEVCAVPTFVEVNGAAQDDMS